MKEKKFLFLSIQQLVLLFYFIVTTTIFFLALTQGNQGISIRLFGGGDDGYFYWEQAKNIASGKEAIITSIYPVILGYIIKFTGIENVYIIRMFNYFGFILLIIFTSHLIKIIFKYDKPDINRKYIYEAKIMLLILFLFYASLQMNVNLSIYRDIWIYTLYILSTILSVKLLFQKNNRIWYFILLMPSLWLLGEFRTYALLSFILVCIVYFFYKIIKKIVNKIFLFISIVSLFGIYYVFLIDFNVPVVNMTLRDVLNYRRDFITLYPGGSQMWIHLDTSNYLLFLINYVHSYIGNLLGPLPWHISGISTLFVFFVETIPMILILLFIWRNRHLLSPVQKYILLHSFIWISLIAVSNDNIGTATRLRPVAWILILTVFVVIYANRKYVRTLGYNRENSMR